MGDQLTLSALIKQACDIFAPADASTRYYTAALHHAQAFRRELISGTNRELKTEELQLGDDRTVDLPDDYAEYRMIGMRLPGWGGVRNLAYNSVISLIPGENIAPNWSSASQVPDYLIAPTSNECSQALYGSVDDGYTGYCGFGVPCWEGEFRIDRQQHRLICNSRVPAEAIIVLEYHSFGAPDGKDIPIDAFAHSWGINYILWKLYLQKKDIQMAREYERLTGIEKAKHTRRTSPLSLEGIQNANHNAAAQRWK